MVQYKHTEDKQAWRNERPLSAFVRGERIVRKKGEERALMDRKRNRHRERQEIAGWIT